jgi:hypothetical protein
MVLVPIAQFPSACAPSSSSFSDIRIGLQATHIDTSSPHRQEDLPDLSIATRTTFCPIKQTARFGAVNKFLVVHLLCLLKPIAARS